MGGVQIRRRPSRRRSRRPLSRRRVKVVISAGFRASCISSLRPPLYELGPSRLSQAGSRPSRRERGDSGLQRATGWPGRAISGGRLDCRFIVSEDERGDGDARPIWGPSHVQRLVWLDHGPWVHLFGGDDVAPGSILTKQTDPPPPSKSPSPSLELERAEEKSTKHPSGLTE